MTLLSINIHCIRARASCACILCIEYNTYKLVHIRLHAYHMLTYMHACMLTPSCDSFPRAVLKYGTNWWARLCHVILSNSAAHLQKCLPVYCHSSALCTYTHTHTYKMPTYTHTCVYIYIYTCFCTYVYIYIYMYM